MWLRSAAFHRAATKPRTVIRPKKNTKTAVATTLRWANTLVLPEPVGRENRQRRQGDQDQLEPVEEGDSEKRRHFPVVKGCPERDESGNNHEKQPQNVPPSTAMAPSAPLRREDGLSENCRSGRVPYRSREEESAFGFREPLIMLTGPP